MREKTLRISYSSSFSSNDLRMLRTMLMMIARAGFAPMLSRRSVRRRLVLLLVVIIVRMFILRSSVL